MSIELSIDKKNDLIRRTITGTATMDEIIASIVQTKDHPDYRPGMNEVTDLRAHAHEASAEDIRKLAQFVQDHVQFTKGTRTAVVVSQAVSYGMARMYQARVEALPSEVAAQIAVFYDLGEAERWLGVT